MFLVLLIFCFRRLVCWKGGSIVQAIRKPRLSRVLSGWRSSQLIDEGSKELMLIDTIDSSIEVLFDHESTLTCTCSSSAQLIYVYIYVSDRN